MPQSIGPNEADFDIHLRNTSAALVLVDAIRVLTQTTVNNSSPDEVYSAQLSIQSMCAVLSRRISESVDFLEECASASQAREEATPDCVKRNHEAA